MKKRKIKSLMCQPIPQLYATTAVTVSIQKSPSKLAVI